ncbi:hypothetical protein BT69DRAFT_1293321 [Atractiella rhizophila]|nr:hypothetical protein BT69DRAFT_1293321 [Atractiella rhizophila]
MGGRGEPGGGSIGGSRARAADFGALIFLLACVWIELPEAVDATDILFDAILSVVIWLEAPSTTSSLPSLVAGLASGAIISYGTVRAVRNNKQVDVILGISVFLLVFFGRRFLNSKKIMPAGLVTAPYYYPMMGGRFWTEDADELVRLDKETGRQQVQVIELEAG